MSVDNEIENQGPIDRPIDLAIDRGPRLAVCMWMCVCGLGGVCINWGHPIPCVV
jgi:hypothetical protein